jgi:hypothetical protein
MMPEPDTSGIPPAVADSTRELATPPVPSAPRWYHKVSAILFITFCLEIGIFLLVFPWTEWWDANYFSGLFPAWEPYWDNMYVRGAISGLGVVNLYISFIEIFRLRRFSRR